jgi:malto-oligosyltrehalose trehalohydrolase
VYAKSQFFNHKIHTPWGDAINFSHDFVRDFYVNNALYWLEEYHFDGLRLDAVQAIYDRSKNHILYEIAIKVQKYFENTRQIHLIVENEDNQSRYIQHDKNITPIYYNAQWNDDFHHSLHVAATGENRGYYIDYSKAVKEKPPSYFIARTLTEGFAYQGEPSFYKNGENRGEFSKDLHPMSFINFIQNHDQTGNRAFGERLSHLTTPDLYKLCAAVYLLAPSVPMLFMGEEWAASTSFLYFCDFPEELASAVKEGRRKEFSKFPEFCLPESVKAIPDPTDEETFNKSVLNWNEINEKYHSEVLEYYKTLIRLRKEYVIPVLCNIDQEKTSCSLFNDYAFCAIWHVEGEKPSVLKLFANFGDKPVMTGGIHCEKSFMESEKGVFRELEKTKKLMPFCVCWSLDRADIGGKFNEQAKAYKKISPA